MGRVKVKKTPQQQQQQQQKEEEGDDAAAAAPQPLPPRPTSPLTDHTTALREDLEACQDARELFLGVLVYEALRR